MNFENFIVISSISADCNLFLKKQ